MSHLDWQSVASGVWKTRIGSGDVVDLLSHAGASPKTDALDKMAAPPFPLDQEDISATESAGRVCISIPYGASEKLYGLGLNFKSIEVQQTVRHLHVDHYRGNDDGRTHAPVPFYVSSKGYGVFVNLARYVSVYAGGSHRTENHPPVVDRVSSPEWRDVQPSCAVELVVPEPGAEIFIFAGPTCLNVVRRFNLYCGGGCLPPRWGLGFWHRVPMPYSDTDTVAEVDEFATRGFPLDVVGLEPGWHTQAYPTTYEWHAERFPHPERFMRQMTEKGVRVNLWENCYVAPACSLGEKIRDLCASHTGGWGGLVPDLALKEARDVVSRQHESEHVDKGASGYKLDECDGVDRWIWPDHASFPSGLSGEQMRQIYGLLFQQLTTDLFRKRNLRTYGLVRASNAGSVSLPYVIYNDHYDHREFITALCSSSFCGLLWTPEARASASSEEWLRRMQSVCFSPLAMINAWADGTKPWSFEDVAALVKDVMMLRTRLIPYIYSAFAQYREDGTPPFRAMVLDDGFATSPSQHEQGELDSTANPYNAAAASDVKDQYLMGPSILVAPVFAGQTERTVVLPAGAWFDFYTGERIASGPATITIAAPLEQIPLLVRDGGIIPLMAAAQHAPRGGEKVDLEVRHYGTSPGAYDLYGDDGETFDHEKGLYSWTRLSAEPDGSGALRGNATAPPGSETFTYGALRWHFMTGV